jgi:hypothetical protein
MKTIMEQPFVPLDLHQLAGSAGKALMSPIPGIRRRENHAWRVRTSVVCIWRGNVAPRRLTRQQLAQFGQRPGVDHIIGGQPCSPRLIDSI